MDPIKAVPIVQNKRSIKLSALFLLMLFSLIGASIYISGLFGPHFLQFFIFMLLFLLPILIIFRSVFLDFLPSFIKDNLNIVEDKPEKNYDPIKDITIKTKRNDYFKMVVAFLCIASSIFFLMASKKDIPINTTSTTANTPTANTPTANTPTANKPTINIPTSKPPTANVPTINTTTVADTTISATDASIPSNTSATKAVQISQNGGGSKSPFTNLGYALFFTLMGLYVTSQGL